MDRIEKETVVVEGRNSNPMSWVIPLVVLILVVLAFLYFGGMNMFNGAKGQPNDVNVNVPDSVKVEPANP